MSKHRLRVCIGYKDDDSPIIKQICATSEFELADLAARALLKSARRNEFVADVPVQKAIPSFGKYATEWLKTYKKGKLKPTTLKGYVSILNTHFYPAWRQTPIDQISTKVIQDFLCEKKWLFTESCGMYLFVYEISLRDRSYNRLRHRAFHGEAVPGDEKLNAKIPQLFVMNQRNTCPPSIFMTCGCSSLKSWILL